MKILVNLYFFTPKSATGVFVYADNLIRELVKQDKESIYWIAAKTDMARYLKKVLGDRANVKYLVFGKYSFFLSRALARLLQKRSLVEAAMRWKFQKIADKNDIDIVFYPSGSINPDGLLDVKTVATLFDLQFEYFPDNFPAKYLKVRREGNYNAAIRSDRVLAISEHTKATLVEKYGINPNKITVTPLASQEFNEPEEISLPGQYIFYPAAIWPHKNHIVLLRAFIRLKDKFPKLNLVLTGIKKWEGVFEDINNEVNAHGVQNRVHYLGHVSGGALNNIYKNARAVAFPSGFEGFGIPLVEALSFGVPVVAANNTSIPEVIGDAGILVPTGDSVALADAVSRVLVDDKLRAELIFRGYERVKLFSWEITAQKTLAVFEEMVKG